MFMPSLSEEGPCGPIDRLAILCIMCE
jgi:hypothetical protein